MLKLLNLSETLYDRIIWIFTVMLVAIIGLFDGHELMQILMYGITGCVFFLILLKERSQFRPRICKYHIFIAFFIGFCYLSSLWGWDSDSASITSGYILRIFICMSVFYYHYEKLESIEPLLSAIKWGGYILAIVSLIGYDPRNILEILLRGGRVYNGFTCQYGGVYDIPGLFYGIFNPNINYLGMQIALAAVAGIFDIVYRKKNILIELLGLLPALLLVAVSGGKMNFLIVILGAGLILLFKTKHTSAKITIKRWLLLFAFFCMAVLVLSFIPTFRMTFERFVTIAQDLMNTSNKMPTDERIIMIQVSMEQFKKTPLAGIGIDNSWILLEQAMGRSTYTHCNYMELLLGVGILGTLLFYIWWLYPVYQFWKYRKQGDNNLIICIIWILISLVIDVAIVTYSIRTTYLYIALLFIEAKKLRDLN